MAHTKSAEKRLRQNLKRRARNRADIKVIKKQIRKLEEVVKGGPADRVLAEFKNTVKHLDKAASRRVIHPNAAARKKSQLARLVQAKAAAK